MTSPTDPVATVLAEAERQRRNERAAQQSAGTVSAAASTGDATTGGTLPGNIVVTDANGRIPADLLYASPSTSFTWTQTAPSAVWTITHPLGGYPEVRRVETPGGEVRGQVDWPDTQHVVISFGHPQSGTAELAL